MLGDRTQAPSGAGYALENRIVMTRTLPEAFRDCRVHRLALFFQTFRDTLRALAPRNRDNPRVVLLTPGPYNETYFEHAYLARYLGYTLVEGGDLTVRDNRVFLKVLGGLQPVDVIFRRLDDDFCDPLELRPDSFLGVPGLVHAVRSGNVAVANALGTGLLETPALPAFLPRLCRALLGEELLLESVPTWWCGDPESLRYVLDHLADLVIKPAFPATRMEPVFPADLPAEQRAALADRIRAPAARLRRPEPRSTSPRPRCWTAASSFRGRWWCGRTWPPSRGRVRVHARRADAGERRAGHDGRVDAAGRREQGHLGARGRGGERLQPAPGGRLPGRADRGRAATCRAGPRTTCSGSAATPSGPRG